jgi:hypothetical protein
VVHQCQCLPLGLEARHDLPRIHSGFNQFDCYAPANRPALLGKPYFTHAALADQSKQTVPVIYGSTSLSGRRLRSKGNVLQKARRRRAIFQGAVQLFLCAAEQRLDFGLKLRVFSARMCEVGQALARLLGESGVVQRLNDCPAPGVHRIPFFSFRE